MVKKNRNSLNMIHCACVIHGKGYDWEYVEKLYNMVSRNLRGEIKFHVYTEHHRSVPPHMIKHVLEDWEGITGPKKSWWYKMQLFNPEHHADNLLYLDLDVVVTGNLNWITQESTDYFWTIRDFRYLQRPTHNAMNSSLMWWNVPKFAHIWKDFNKGRIADNIKPFQGDQDYLEHAIDHNQKRYFPAEHTQSYRWQAHDGGMDFKLRKPIKPGAGTVVPPETSLLVFHGHPKPHEIRNNPVIKEYWK